MKKIKKHMAKIKIAAIKRQANKRHKVVFLNRLTKRQFQAMMKNASQELLITDKKTLPLLNLDLARNYTTEEQINLILSTLNLSSDAFGQTVTQKYRQIIRSKRIRNRKDKMAVLSYLIGAQNKIPMCLLDKNLKNDSVRKILKPWGDIKEHQPRLIPDAEYLKEVAGKERSKYDYFDGLDTDKKIRWARYANLILKIEPYHSGRSIKELIKSIGEESIVFAMKYACKMAKVPVFKGIFTSSYWIAYRTDKYSNGVSMTSEEMAVFNRMAFEHLSISNGSTLPIIDEASAISLLEPSLPKKYQQLLKRDPKLRNLNTIRELLLNHD